MSDFLTVFGAALVVLASYQLGRARGRLEERRREQGESPKARAYARSQQIVAGMTDAQCARLVRAPDGPQPAPLTPTHEPKPRRFQRRNPTGLGDQFDTTA
jgi:hypothetical protein